MNDVTSTPAVTALSVAVARSVVAPFCVLIDQREGLPYTFSGIQTDPSDKRGGSLRVIVPSEITHVVTGDYTLRGFEDRVAVERKSLSDAFGTFGGSRARFARELERLNELEVAAVVVEADWRTVMDAWPAALRDCVAYLRLVADPVPIACASKPNFAGGATAADLTEWADMLTYILGRPPERSQLNPKTVWRSVNAWEQRYPRVHFHFLPDRAWAEVKTYRILERFYDDIVSGKRPATTTPARKPFASAVTSSAADDPDLAGILADIEAAIDAAGNLPSQADEFAESVVEKLESIRGWIEDHDDVTAAQREAVANMAAGIERWAR